MIWLVAASLLSAPQPRNEVDWFDHADIPVNELKSDVPMLVRFGLTVSDKGKVEDCRIYTSSGNPRLDKHSCRLAMRRARFRPAIDEGGKPIYGTHRGNTVWWMGDNPATRFGRWPFSGDLELITPKLSVGITSPVYDSLVVAVDAAGRPSACEPGPKNDDPAILTRTACAELLKRYVAIPTKDRAGNPVPSVQNAIVRFVIE